MATEQTSFFLKTLLTEESKTLKLLKMLHVVGWRREAYPSEMGVDVFDAFNTQTRGIRQRRQYIT